MADIGKKQVVLVIFLIVQLALTPTVVDQVQNLNTSGWSFTGYAGARTLVGLIPFVWIAGILLNIMMIVLSTRGD